MLRNRQFLSHAALTVVHLAAGVVLLLESASADAICAFAAAALYGVITGGQHQASSPIDMHRPASTRG